MTSFECRERLAAAQRRRNLVLDFNEPRVIAKRIVERRLNSPGCRHLQRPSLTCGSCEPGERAFSVLEADIDERDVQRISKRFGRG